MKSKTLVITIILLGLISFGCGMPNDNPSISESQKDVTPDLQKITETNNESDTFSFSAGVMDPLDVTTELKTEVIVTDKVKQDTTEESHASFIDTIFTESTSLLHHETASMLSVSETTTVAETITAIETTMPIVDVSPPVTDNISHTTTEAETITSPKDSEPIEVTKHESESTKEVVVTSSTIITTIDESSDNIESKTIYDYPIDTEMICKELILLGESVGMKHRTSYKDGTQVTPENSSWELPITVTADFCGEMLKRSLYDYVTSYSEYNLYGGAEIKNFTIYVSSISEGYEFYFLH